MDYHILHFTPKIPSLMEEFLPYPGSLLLDKRDLFFSEKGEFTVNMSIYSKHSSMQHI